MFFKRSIDNDGELKQLLLEELVLEQLKYFEKPGPDGTHGWMGFPWCIELLRTRLRLQGLKASDLVMSAIVNAATGLARDIASRRECELGSAKARVDPATAHEIELGFSVMLFMESLSRLDPSSATPRVRQELLRMIGEASHQLRMLMNMPGGRDAGIDRMYEEWKQQLSADERRQKLEQTTAWLKRLSQREEPYQFDLQRE